MGGGHGADPPVMEEIQDGDGQGRPFRGIRSGSQFIEEAQGICVRMVQDVDDTLHMGRKGGQALFYTLLIPDIRIYL